MKPTDSFRKIPKQVRAEATVSAILEATAQILQAENPKAATTNAIARRAGVSIGTLYQYFPNKNAILITLARRELAFTGTAVNAEIASQMGGKVQTDPLRAAIHALIQGFSGRLRTRKALIEALIAHGLSEELTLPVDRAMRDMLAARTSGDVDGCLEISPITAYVLTRAIIGVIRSAVMEESPYFGTQVFEDELVGLAHSMLST
ncbi:TetR/AcrR family transcriptional regulator [Martelella sp. HB161492]|uniref:TetR/AcrR family transcriptional regulator n=1 Tax=Martelella sp. HB161492 TaxID=2720726 RepID=UPI00159204A2|nr:TetR/AcrR family transcriptional regulator [Martelella sp. HB161492]